METDYYIKEKALTPEEYAKRVDEYCVAGDIKGFLELQRTHSILHADPIPEGDRKFLEKLDISELPENFEIGLV